MTLQRKTIASKRADGTQPHHRKRKKRWNFEDVTAAPPPTLVQGVPYSGAQSLFNFKRDDCPQEAVSQQKSPQSVDADYGAIQRREAPQVPRIVAADSPAVNGFSITHEEFLNGKASRSI